MGRVIVSCLLVSFRLDLEGVFELNQTIFNEITS